MGEIEFFMRQVQASILLFVFALTAFGCAVRRVDFNDPISTQSLAFIRPGETTLQHVVDRLGGPEDITLTSDQVVAEFQWSTTRSASLNLGYLFRLVSPISPSMTMSGTGINIERLILICDERLLVRSYAFGKADEHAFFEFWPF